MTTTSHPTSDREALSALFDGELTGDAARFALKRLDHDQEWRVTCDRWRVVGEALRGQGTLLPATFPMRVRDAMRTEPAEPARAVDTGVKWTRPRWSSVALAASAAMVAFFLARSPVGTDTPASTSPQVAARAMQGAPAPKPQTPATQAPPAPEAPSVVEAASAAVAVASVARPSQRARNLQRDRAATDRIVSSAVAAQTAITGEAPATVIASQPTESAPLAPAASPFSGTVESRPWPRAVLPEYSGNGTLAADYATAPSFYPFSPSHAPAPAKPADEPQPAPTQP